MEKKKHRSEFCTLFIRENFKFFRYQNINVNKKFYRKDLRLTVDNPEDLILCRELYKRFKNQAPKIRIGNIIQYLDENKKLIKLTQKFTELSR